MYLKWHVIGYLILCFVVNPPFEVYFLLYGVYVTTYLSRWPKLGELSERNVVCVLLLAVGLVVLLVTKPFEIRGRVVWYDWNSVNKSLSFFQLVDPALPYMGDILALRGVANAGSRFVFGDVITRNVTVWDSDVLRWDLVFRYWNAADATAPLVCFVEADVVVDADYIAKTFERSGMDIAYINHFWGLHVFERYNTGVLCVRKKVGFFTWLWALCVRWVLSLRWRRVLPYDVLIPFFPSRFEFGWVTSKGCARFFPGCHYTHFTGQNKRALAHASLLAWNRSNVLY